MAISIERLLNQKGWTGQELGVLEVTNAVYAYGEDTQGKKNPSSISVTEFRKMLDTLEDPEDIKIYNGYIALHRWMALKYATACTVVQQIQFRLSRLTNRMQLTKMAEDAYQYVESLPFIVTEKQYKDIVEKRTKEILYPNGEPQYHNLFEVVEQAIRFYVSQLKEDPHKKNPLKQLKTKLEKELVTDPRILTRYNKVTKRGYYTTEDGTRSDETSKEAWQKRVLGFNPKEGEDPQKEFARKMLMCQSEYEGKSKNEYEKEAREKGLITGEATKWHYYDSPPKDLTKWDIIKDGELCEYYRSLLCEDEQGNELICQSDEHMQAMAADAAAFKKEFPSIVEAILKDMEQHIKGVSSIPVEKWGEPIERLEKLAKDDVYGFSERINNMTIFIGNMRALLNGVAIVRSVTSLGTTRIDENGYYKPPKIKSQFAMFDLSGLFPESEHYAENVRVLEEDKKVLLDSIYWLNGYNKAMELTRKKFEIDALKLLEYPTDDYVKQIKGFNGFISAFYSIIKDTDYEDKELKQKKLNVLKDTFTPIILDSVKTPESKIKIAKTWLKRGFEIFKKNEFDLCNLLCIGRCEEKDL